MPQELHTSSIQDWTLGLRPNDRRAILKLPMGHLLGHVQHELAVLIVGFAQHPAKLAQESRILARAAPKVIVRLPLGKIR